MTLPTAGAYNQDVVVFQGGAAQVGSAGWVGAFYNGKYFWWDFKFIRVQIGCEGPSGPGGGILGSG